MRVWIQEYLSGGGTLDMPVRDRAELLAQGQAMRDALAADLEAIPGCQVSVASPDGCDSSLDRLRRQAALHDAVWVIAPESDGLLARLCEAVPPARWIGCTAAAIRLTTSKRATLEHLAAAGLPTPLGFGERAAAWVVKPDDGAGSVETQRHTSLAAARADLGQRQRDGRAAVIEPWVDGEALSISLICGRGAARLLAINRQRVGVDADGVVRYGGVDVNTVSSDDPRAGPLRDLAARIAGAVPGLQGLVGVDLVWHALHGPVVIEINPRVTSAYVGLSASLGFNVAAAVLAAQAGDAND